MEGACEVGSKQTDAYMARISFGIFLTWKFRRYLELHGFQVHFEKLIQSTRTTLGSKPAEM